MSLLMPPRGVAHRRVHDRPDRAGQVVGRDALQERLGIRTADPGLGQRGQVEHRRPLAGRAVLGRGAGRPEHPGPAIAPRGRVRPVDVEPLRPLEALALEELGAELLELLVERRGPQRPGHAQGLERVDEVVHLVVVAGAAGTHVGARRLDRLEPVDVHLVDVEARVAVGDPVGHDPTDPAAVGDPHGLGDPRPADARGRTHDREPVRGEREHPVEGEVEARRGERRQEPAGVGPGGVEVLRRPGRERRHVLVLAVRIDPGHAGRRRRCRAAGCRAGRRAAGRAGTTRPHSGRRAGGSTSPGPGRASSGGWPRPRGRRRPAPGRAS